MGCSRRTQGSVDLVRAFVLFGGLIVLALLGALVAPYFVDWTAYRSDFEREASRILGRQVVVKGDASATLLPFPSVTFEDVEVLGEDRAPLLTIDRFRMDAELAPYLSGEILIYSMTLDRPHIAVPIDPDGSVSWVIARPQIPSGATVVLEKVLVHEGSARIENGITGRSQELSGIEATLSAASLAGPFNGQGAVDVAGARIGFTVDSGALQPDDTLPLRIETTDPRLDAKITIDGKAQVVDGRPRFTGNASLLRPLPPAPATTGDDPFAVAGGGRPAPPRPDAEASAKLALRATGALALTASEAALTDIRLQAGGGERQPYVLTGTGSLDFGTTPRFSLDLTGEQVDVDAIASGDDAEGSPAGTEAPAARRPISLAERLETVREVLAAVPRPSVEGAVSISLPVVVAGDTTIRDVAFTTHPRDDGWLLERFAAELPGRTRLEASGTVDVDDRFAFEGDLLLASNQPSGFSDWLSGEVAPSVRRLAQAGFSAKAKLTTDRQELDDLEIDIGGERLAGRLVRDRSGGNTSLTADLSGGAIDLDAFLSLAKVMTGSPNAAAGATSFDVALKAGPVTLRDASAESVSADVRFDGNRLGIDTLDVRGLAGASFTAKGQLSDVVGDATGQLEVTLNSPEPAAFFDFVTTRLPGVPVLEALRDQARHLAPLAVSGEIETIEGDPGKLPTLYVRLDGTANGSKLDLSTSIENGFSALRKSGRFGLDLRLENDRPTALLDQLGIASVDVGAPSPLEAELSLSAAATGPIVTTATLRAPGSELSFDGLLTVTPEGVTGVEASLYLNSEDIAPWLRSRALDLGQSFETLPVGLNSSLVYADGGWTLANIEGTVGDDRLTADVALPAGQPIKASAHVETLSAAWLAGLVYGSSFDTPVDGAAWPTQAFAQSQLPSRAFSVALKADRFDVGGVAMRDLSTTVSGDRGSLVLDGSKIRVGEGQLSGRVELRNANGTGSVGLDVEASGLDLASLFPALAVGTASRLDGDIRLEGTGQSYAGLVGGLTGAGRVTVEDAAIPKVPTAFLKPLLAAADTQGFSPPADTAAAFGKVSEGERFPVPALDSEFAVSAGVLRFAPVTIPAETSSLTLDGTIDLADLDVNGSLRLAVDPGDDGVSGAEPTVTYGLAGTLFDARLTPDLGPLTNYLSVRALEREQARVEAMQENLQETLRLRREARYYRWREARAGEIVEERRLALEEEERQREAERAKAEAAERQAEEEARQAAREAAARAEAERRQAAEAAAAADAAKRAAERAAQQRPLEAPSTTARREARPSSGSGNAPALDFDTSPPASALPGGDYNLPGVSNPLDF